MHRCADHCTGEAQSFSAVPLHLGAEYQFWCCCGHRCFYLEVVITDEGLKSHRFRCRSHGSSHFSAVSAEANHFKAELVFADPCCCQGMGSISKDEHPFPCEVGGIDGFGVPGQPGLTNSRLRGRWCHPQKIVNFNKEVLGCADANRHGAGEWDSKTALEPSAAGFRDLWVEAHIEVGFWESMHICHRGSQRSDHPHVDAMHA